MSKTKLAAASCAAAILAAMAGAASASAQGLDLGLSSPPVGKQAGGVMVRLRAIGVIPQDSSSSVSVIGGHVDTSA